jgi:hypothetical protein
MNKPVQHPAVGVEFADQGVEKSPVTVFIFAPSRVGYQIRELRQPRRLRVHKERRFRQAAEMTPSPSVDAEMSSQGLQRPLVSGFVQTINPR